MDLERHAARERGKITLCTILFRDDTIFKGYQMASAVCARTGLMVTSVLSEAL